MTAWQQSCVLCILICPLNSLHAPGASTVWPLLTPLSSIYCSQSTLHSFTNALSVHDSPASSYKILSQKLWNTNWSLEVALSSRSVLGDSSTSLIMLPTMVGAR